MTCSAARWDINNKWRRKERNVCMSSFINSNCWKNNSQHRHTRTLMSSIENKSKRQVKKQARTMSSATGNEGGVCKNILHICSERILSPSGQATIDDYKWTSSFAEKGTTSSRWHPASHGGFCWDVSSLIDVFCRMQTFHHHDFVHRIMNFCLVVVVVFGFIDIHIYVSWVYFSLYQYLVLGITHKSEPYSASVQSIFILGSQKQQTRSQLFKMKIFNPQITNLLLHIISLISRNV